MDGIHSATECVTAWIQRPELAIYPIKCSMRSSSNVLSHSRMHKKRGSQLASELNSCFLSGFVFHTFLSLKHSRFSARNSHDVKPFSDTCTTDVRSVAHLCFYWITSILVVFMHFTPLDDKGFDFSGQWVFNCFVSTFSLYPRHLTFQSQACLFESLSSAPVQWLSGCLRRSFHSLQLIYRYTFLRVHVLGMAVIVENGTPWRAVLACLFLPVDPWNVVNFKIKFWYSKLS